MPPLSEARGSVAHTQTDFRSIEVSTGSIGTGETDQNPDENKVSQPSISLADIEECSYFIQYHPELSEKFSQVKSSSVPVSSRTLAIVFSRLLYWSRYSKWRFRGKLYFWKSQEELGSETGYSTKTINRALKVLVELGLIVRDKFHKHFYRQVYFYHIPVSPFTKEVAAGGGTRGTTRRSNTSSNRPTRAIGGHQQTFHKAAAPEEQVVTAGVAPTGGSSGAAAAGALVETKRKGSSKKRGFLSVLGAAAVPSVSRPISQGKGFASIPADCPYQSQEPHSLIKHSLKSIVDKCNFYGTNPPKPINGG